MLHLVQTNSTVIVMLSACLVLVETPESSCASYPDRALFSLINWGLTCDMVGTSIFVVRVPKKW